MAASNFAFKLLSLNARGIRSFEKRKAVFGWVMRQQVDICFIQETYSTKEVENVWKKQWKGEMYFSHGSVHSRGVLVLIKNSLEFQIKSMRQDKEGRFIFLEALVQDQKFLLVNIYAPNKTSEQTYYFDKIKEELDNIDIDDDCRIIIGGDFNVILDPDLDGWGGKPKLKESVKQIENICLLYDLVDIWRLRNPGIRRFTWMQKTPMIQRRLDFWLTDNALQEEIEQVSIIPSIKSDHSAILLSINGIEEKLHGPSFWKFNASLLDDNDYVALINDNYQVWVEEFRDIQDPRLLWDLIKYKIRQETISYSKRKARERKAKLTTLEEKLTILQELCDQDPSTDTKLRAFQYKLLNHIVYTNDRLYKFKIVDSPLCAFCNSENESLEHLFLCKASEVFWKEVLSWLAIHKNELLNVSLTDVLFGKFDIDKDFMVVNHVLLLGKYFIYRCKLDNIKPSLAVFKAKLKATLNLEFYIARKKGTLAQHYRKWNIFIPVLI